MNRYIYLDNAATKPVSQEVLKAMQPYYYEIYANPSSTYRQASKSSYAVYEARERIASLLGAKEEEILFTSGGSESNSWVIQGIAEAYKMNGNHIITSTIEHPSLLNACKALEKRGYRVTYLSVDQNGLIDLNDLEQAINEDTILISIMTVNNEVGSIQPINRIGEIAKKHNVLFHTDAVQGFGHIPINVNEMSIDLMSASGHKFGAPKGIGFLYIREGLKIEPLVYGGDQEYGLRGGTSNVPSIVGMGVAAEISVHRMEDADKAMKELKEYFIEKISSLVPRVRFNAESDAHIASNISMTIDRLPGERLLVYLDTKGVQVSMGSSCKARSHERSHVLRAIGLTDTQIDSTIRITMSEETTKDDIDYVIDCISRCVELSVC